MGPEIGWSVQSLNVDSRHMLACGFTAVEDQGFGRDTNESEIAVEGEITMMPCFECTPYRYPNPMNTGMKRVDYSPYDETPPTSKETSPNASFLEMLRKTVPLEEAMKSYTVKVVRKV